MTRAAPDPLDTLLTNNTIQVASPPKPAFDVVTNPHPPASLKTVLDQFEAEIKASGVKYEKAEHTAGTSPAHFTPFTFYPGEGKPTYSNTMFVDEREGRTAGEITASKRHEAAHAILWSKLAAAHASPYNLASPIVLCPRDWGRLTRNSERAAMAYNAMLGFADPDMNVRAAMKKEPATVENFAAAMAANNNNLEVALNRVARECLEQNSNFYMLTRPERPEKEALSLRNYYTWYSLLKFQESALFTHDYELSDLPAPIFVRLDDQDILEIGQLLGLDAFGGEGRPDSFFTEQAPLMWKHQKWQNTQNFHFNILDSNQLPTVREALRDYFGKTPEEFLVFSKNFKQGDKPLQQIKPVVPVNVPVVTYN